MYLYCLAILFLSGACNGINFAQSPQDVKTPVVTTSTGIIAGKLDQVYGAGIISYVGIPFAKPPLGNKRFAQPEPIDPWNGILLADTKSAACMQYSSRNYEWIPKDLNVSEDCLYLNIWVPLDQPDQSVLPLSDPLPVMVWIHGGGSFAGSASMELYDGKILAAGGRVIVASMNYRLGLFGYLTADTQDAPGNAGLLDQLMALKWIKSNIAQFGGDDSKITIFGWSAGSLSVGLHLISPMSKNLFHAAIMESSSIWTSLIDEDTDKAMGRANNLALQAGCADANNNITTNPDVVVNCLKQQDALSLAYIDDKSTSKFPSNFRYHFGSNCNGCNLNPFLPDRLVKMLKPITLPIIVGVVKNEATELFLNYAAPNKFPLNSTPDVTVAEAKGILYNFISSIPGVSVDDVNQYYFGNIDETNATAIVKSLSDAISDFFVVCPSLFLAENADKSYLYWFSHHSDKDQNAAWVGVPHITEVYYIFGKPFSKPDNFTDVDRGFSKTMIEIWSTFAYNQYPGSTPSWIEFDQYNPMSYRLNPEKQGMIRFPRSTACTLWRKPETGTIAQ